MIKIARGANFVQFIITRELLVHGIVFNRKLLQRAFARRELNILSIAKEQRNNHSGC